MGITSTSMELRSMGPVLFAALLCFVVQGQEPVTLQQYDLGSGGRAFSCPPDAPYLDGKGECLPDCPSGQAPDSSMQCMACDGDLPYADHTAKKCVAVCGPHHAPDTDQDCKPCSNPQK